MNKVELIKSYYIYYISINQINEVTFEITSKDIYHFITSLQNISLG